MWQESHSYLIKRRNMANKYSSSDGYGLGLATWRICSNFRLLWDKGYRRLVPLFIFPSFRGKMLRIPGIASINIWFRLIHATPPTEVEFEWIENRFQLSAADATPRIIQTIMRNNWSIPCVNSEINKDASVKVFRLVSRTLIFKVEICWNMHMHFQAFHFLETDTFFRWTFCIMNGNDARSKIRNFVAASGWSQLLPRNI